MEFLSKSHRPKGHSTIKPPLFNKSNYDYWKFKMMIYIKSTNTIVWKVIKEGYSSPIKLESIIILPKLKSEWDKDYYKKERIHAKAMNAIMCAITISKLCGTNLR